MTKTLHWVAMTGVLTAVMVVARLFVHPWPNVTPFTALVILVAWYFGWRIGLASGKSCCDFNGIVVGDAPGGDGATDFVCRFGIDYQW